MTSATYDTTCTNPVTCNQPISTTDELGRKTDYTYDSVHGGVLTKTLPAATTGGDRPQIRYSYAQFYAYYKNAAGTIVAAPTPVWRLTGTSTCITGSSCAGTAAELKTTISYGATGVANNLLPVSTTTSAGDGSLSATTSVTYDSVGNKTSEDGPLPGNADTTIYSYDADQLPTQVTGPDPDGTGPLKNRSVKTTYNNAGLPIAVTTGTANADGSGFVELRRAETTYDNFLRKVKETALSSGVIQSRVDYNYDTLGRLNCTATRMNPAQFASLAVDACTLGTEGAFGPDRISRNIYDGLSRLRQVKSAVGTSLERANYTTTLGGSDQIITYKDAKGNLTTYEYDQFDRLVKTRYPSPTTVNTSSTTDYEQLTLDVKSQVTQRRLRDGKQIAYSYDNLGRQTLAHPLNPVDGNDVDQGATYDLLGRKLSATDAGGRGVSYSYDVFGRTLSETPALTAGAATFQYDVAGRRTRLTWSDGFYVSYDYDLLGEMIAVRENGAGSGAGVLATFAYDDMGRRTGLARGNGVNDAYGYDSAGRLASLAIAHATAGNSYSYAYNPAGQLISRGMSNDAYAWTQGVTVNRAYAVNGLNQYTASGAVVPTYDGRGNLTSAGSTAYGYDSRNHLATFGTTTLLYDGLGRLAAQSSPATRFVQQGSDLIAETDASNAILRRYVHGPGTDEVLVWYEGAGTSDKRWLARDERGSTTLITDASATVVGINAYDEYGIPQSTNLGRFQYTGQTWLPELGMYYYKARIYSATLGRFLQTDPIGYDDGPNWYNYAHGDPINGTDSTGNNINIECMSCVHNDGGSGGEAGIGTNIRGMTCQSCSGNYPGSMSVENTTFGQGGWGHYENANTHGPSFVNSLGEIEIDTHRIWILDGTSDFTTNLAISVLAAEGQDPEPKSSKVDCQADPNLAGLLGGAAGAYAPDVRPLANVATTFLKGEIGKAMVEGVEIGGEAGGPGGALGGLIVGAAVGGLAYYIDHHTSGSISKPIASLATGCTP